MTLVLPHSPENWQEVTRERMEVLLRSRVKGEADPEATDLIPLYQLTSDNASEQGVAKGSVLAGWRTLVFDGEIPIAAVDISDEEGTLLVDGCRGGKSLKPIVRGIASASDFAQTRQEDYELRFLQAPGLPFSAVWLSARPAGEDWIIPLVRVEGRESFQPVPLPDLEPYLKGLAKKELDARRQFQEVSRDEAVVREASPQNPTPEPAEGG